VRLTPMLAALAGSGMIVLVLGPDYELPCSFWTLVVIP
jgi:hypothetical protein